MVGRNPKLSVVVITKNEEIDLPGFLDNFQAIADEIVIIDDGSTDRTAQIACSAGTNVRYFGDPRQLGQGFSHQRQKGVQAARGTWLLQVDCDMRLTPALAHEITEAIEDESKLAYRFRIKQYFLNRPVSYGGFQYWNQPWLSRREATAWTRAVHERIHIDASADQIGQLKNTMIHLNDVDFSERLRKNHQYSHLLAEEMLTSGKKVSLARVILEPIWHSFRCYVLRKGFLDGRIGLAWAMYQLYGNITPLFLVWARQNCGSRALLEKQIRQAFQHDSSKS